MKTIATAIVATVFSVSINAAEIYHGFGEGNADLTSSRSYDNGFVGVQPGVGDSIDRYHGFADGNPDLFQSSGSDSVRVGSASASDNDQAIYVGPGLEF